MTRKRRSKWGTPIEDIFKSERARREQRICNLSVPITEADVARFVKHLFPVSFGANSECWLYVGCNRDTTLPEEFFIPTSHYANFKFNGEVIGPHVFAYCAEQGITIASLKGFDVHHTSKHGRCIGYRCCNPMHLEQMPAKKHKGIPRGKAALVKRQIKMIREVLGIPADQRRPEADRTKRTRDLGGVQFDVRGGQIDDVIE